MDLTVVAKNIVNKSDKDTYRDLDDNHLLECLYNSYCNITGKNENFSDRVLSSENDAEDIYAGIASDLFAWYEDRYFKSFGMQKGVRGSQGLRRVSTANTYKHLWVAAKDSTKTIFGKYGFSKLYAKKQFYNKFATTSSSEKGQPYMDFILHCCVAFLVSPDEIDDLLKHYGFSQLHVRNIHHLAIYAVLKKAQTLTEKEIETFNPFAEIEGLYTSARDILNDSSLNVANIDKNYIIAGTKTNWIRDYLLSKNFNVENMLQYITSNKNLFTMRHNLILRDCWKYSRLYTHIYYEYGHRNPDGSDWYRNEDNYSLYSFMIRFCLSESFPSEKRFNEILFTEIEKNQKHPSREFMIIIWLFNYCFSSIDNLDISEYTINKLSESYTTEIDDGVTRDNIGEAVRVKNNYHYGEFSISKFIFDDTSSQPFIGSAVIDSIQTRLKEYGWGLLNKNRVFDNFILSLSALDIRYNNNSRKNAVYWKKEFISLIDPLDNIPDALYVITHLFEKIQKAKQTSDLGYYPLECRIYEQA